MIQRSASCFCRIVTKVELPQWQHKTNTRKHFVDSFLRRNFKLFDSFLCAALFAQMCFVKQHKKPLLKQSLHLHVADDKLQHEKQRVL